MPIYKKNAIYFNTVIIQYISPLISIVTNTRVQALVKQLSMDLVTALWSGISPLIFPVWLYLPEATPPPAKLSGS